MAGATAAGAGGPVPPRLAPMLTGAVGMPADPAAWHFEPKWDGVRALATVSAGTVSLTSRLGNDVTAAYPELVPLAGALGGRAAVLDGEVIAFDARGHPSFERLQRRMHARPPGTALVAEVPVLYVAFDLLWLDGRLLTGEGFEARRHHLEALGVQGSHWHTSQLLPAPPTGPMLAACREMGLEGYVAKLARSPYTPGRRSRSWAKVKCVRRRELVVGGWTEGEGGRRGAIGSLAVGWVDPGAAPAAPHPFALRYTGLVGSGLSGELLARLGHRFAGSATDVSPFVPPPPVRGLRFVAPTVVVEVAFTQVTSAGVLRQPSLKGVRDDIDPAGVGWTEELA